MIKTLGAALALLIGATPLHAQSDPDIDAMVAVLRGLSASQFGEPAFKAEPADIYVKPYYEDDTEREKKSRTDWYAAQLPAGFPTKGTISTLYLDRCTPRLPVGELLGDEGERTDPELVRATDMAFISRALEAKGVTGISLGGLQVRDGFQRSAPNPGLRAINTDLQRRFESGSLAQRLVILEPYCPTSDRGTDAQYAEMQERALAKWRRTGGPKPPPLAPPPPPPPHRLPHPRPRRPSRSNSFAPQMRACM